MNAKKKKQKKVALRGKRQKYSDERRPAEWITVGWLLATMTTLAAESAALLGHAMSAESEMAGVFSRYMFFSATVIGTITALLTIAVYRLRNVPPPRAITIVVLVIALAPVPLWVLVFGLS